MTSYDESMTIVANIHCVKCGFTFVPAIMMEPCPKCELRQLREQIAISDIHSVPCEHRSADYGYRCSLVGGHGGEHHFSIAPPPEQAPWRIKDPRDRRIAELEAALRAAQTWLNASCDDIAAQRVPTPHRAIDAALSPSPAQPATATKEDDVTIRVPPMTYCAHGVNHTGERHGCDGCCNAAPPSPAAREASIDPDAEDLLLGPCIDCECTTMEGGLCDCGCHAPPRSTVISSTHKSAPLSKNGEECPFCERTDPHNHGYDAEVMERVIEAARECLGRSYVMVADRERLAAALAALDAAREGKR